MRGKRHLAFSLLILLTYILFMQESIYLRKSFIANAETSTKYANTIKLIMNVGSKTTFDLTGYNSKINIKSFDKNIVEVKQSGVFIGKNKGKTTVIITIGNSVFRYIVTVESPVINKKKATIEVGQKMTLNISGTVTKPTWVTKLLQSIYKNRTSSI